MHKSEAYEFSTISYPFAVGTIKAIEHKLISKETAARLMKATEEEALKILQDIGYGEGAKELTLSLLIKEQLRETEALVKKLSPNHEETDLFLLPNDAHNLKLLIKVNQTNEAIDEYINENGMFPIELLEVCVKNGDFSPLGDIFGEKLADISECTNPQEISNRIDQAVFSFMQDKEKNIKNEVLKHYFEQRNEYYQTLAAMRARNMGWYEKRVLQLFGKEIIEQSIEEVDRALRIQMMNGLRQIENDSFSAGPIICYLLKRRTEAVMLRTIFSAKNGGAQLILDDLFIWEV